MLSIIYNSIFDHSITSERERDGGAWRSSLDLVLFIVIYLCLEVSIPAVQTLVQVSVTTGGPGSAALQKVVLQLVFPEREILPGLSLTTYSQPGLTLQSSCHS